MDIHQERQTLARLAALHAELSAPKTLVPADRRYPQFPSGKRRQSPGQIEIVDPRPLWFREASFAEFGRNRLPHFLPRYRS